MFIFFFISFRTVYNNSNANTLMSALLHYVSRMVEEPQTMFGIHSGGSLVFGIAESLLSIFTFRKTHQDFLSSNDLPTAFREHYPLANQSLVLILILTNHCTASAKNNKYRESLFGCCDSKGMKTHILKIIEFLAQYRKHRFECQLFFFLYFQLIHRRRDTLSKLTLPVYSTHYVKLLPSIKQHYCYIYCCIAISNSINLQCHRKIFSSW